jgi:hypothetical protein
MFFSLFKNEEKNFDQKQRKTLYFGDSVCYYTNLKINSYLNDEGRKMLNSKKESFYIYLTSNKSNYNIYLFNDTNFTNNVYSNSIYDFNLDKNTKIPIITDFDINFDSKYGEINDKQITVRLIHEIPIVFDNKGKIIRK